MAPEYVTIDVDALASSANTIEAIPSRAYVTFLAGTGDYVKGVVGLAKGLRKAKSAYPLVVAILPDVPEEHRQILVSQGCIVREIEPVYPPENQTQFAMAYYVINYSKLRIWEVLNQRTINFLHVCVNCMMWLICMPCMYGYACYYRNEIHSTCDFVLHQSVGPSSQT